MSLRTPRVLISDKLSETAVAIFRGRGIEADFLPEVGRDKKRLLDIIGDYDGLAVRSATKVSSKVLGRAGRLRVIGRAGTGIDNIDLRAATAQGVIVMNTPYGNAITTAEHSIAMMFAAVRHIPSADTSTRSGAWEPARFMGMELSGKTLGLIGCGNIGSLVAERALGLRMRVIAYDPYLSPERAVVLGVEKVELAELLARADVLSLHTPLTEKTRNILSAEALADMKPGAYLVNCSRGGLVDEEALRGALESGHLAGAACDVFVEEPPAGSPLLGAPNLVCTPHLGAATVEAQENVAIQIAGQMSDFLLDGAISNSLNMPSIAADEAPRLVPFVRLAEHLGAFAGQLADSSLQTIRIEYEGKLAEMNKDALTAAVLAGVFKPSLANVNMVSAPMVAQERGIQLEETRRERRGAYETYMRVTLVGDGGAHSIAGTVFSDGKPRIIQVEGLNMEAEFSSHMLYVRNEDRPGFIGHLGMILGGHGLNIATFSLGRNVAGGEALCLVDVDGGVSEDVLKEIANLDYVSSVRNLVF